MSRPLPIGFDRYYPTDLASGYASNGIGEDALTLRRVELDLKQKATATMRDSQPTLLAAVWSAAGTAASPDWDGEGGEAITDQTTTAAIQLVCALPEGLPPPTITPEPTGEIAFEWHKDSRHVTVLTVQDDVIRWSALMGTGAPVHGREFFTRTVPGAALIAIQSAI